MPSTYPFESDSARGWERRMTEVMFAVIKSGGRQYKVSVGQTLEVNRLPVEVGEQVHFNEVLLISDADNTMIGTPLVEDATVLATATKQGRGEKLIVFRYKPKKRIRHRRGHRQELTILTVDDIVADGKSLITGEAPKSREEEEEELPVIAEAETPVESTEVEAATGGVGETAEPDEEEKRSSRRRRTRRTEESESEAEE
jgi:large subunit ribosomal protein L21